MSNYSCGNKKEVSLNLKKNLALEKSSNFFHYEYIQKQEDTSSICLL